MTNTAAIADCFDHAAHSYDEHATVQRRACQAVMQLLGDAEIGTACDLGCGTGYSTQALLNLADPEHITALDCSSDSLHLAKQHLPSGIRFAHANFDDANALQSNYDLILANMSLQWSSDLNNTLRQIKQALTAQGTLALSLPLLGTFEQIKPLRIRSLDSREIIIQRLHQAGFTDIEVNEYMWPLIFDDLSSALHHIKATGAHYCNDQHSDPNSQRWLRHRLKQYRDKPFQLVYRIGCFIARQQHD